MSMESSHVTAKKVMVCPKPPPRSSSIRANLCKFLTNKSSKTSYVLNHDSHHQDCQHDRQSSSQGNRTLPKSHLSSSSLSTSSSSPHEVRSGHPLARLSEERTQAAGSAFSSKQFNFFKSKKQSSSVDTDFNEIPGIPSKKKLWIKSFTSLNGPFAVEDAATNGNENHDSIPHSSSNIPCNPGVQTSAISSQVVDIKTSGVKMRVKKAWEIKKSRPKSEATFFEELYSKKKIESDVEKQLKQQNRYSTIEGNLRFGCHETYARLDQLGEGSYATVYKGYSYLMSKVVALKEIRLEMEEGTPFTAIREASILRCLRHANIVTLHDIIHTKETLTFVFEFVVSNQSVSRQCHRLISYSFVANGLESLFGTSSWRPSSWQC